MAASEKTDTPTLGQKKGLPDCKRCKGSFTLNKDGGFHKHHWVYEKENEIISSECEGSMKLPKETFNGRDWGSCTKCNPELKFKLVGHSNVVERHYWGLMCPGSNKHPGEVVQMPEKFVPDPADVDDLGGKMGKLDAKLDAKPNPKP